MVARCAHPSWAIRPHDASADLGLLARTLGAAKPVLDAQHFTRPTRWTVFAKFPRSEFGDRQEVAGSSMPRFTRGMSSCLARLDQVEVPDVWWYAALNSYAVAREHLDQLARAPGTGRLRLVGTQQRVGPFDGRPAAQRGQCRSVRTSVRCRSHDGAFWRAETKQEDRPCRRG